jgi:murein DD-endopeptidase MepM/ murein hydrolase activator NlpD
MNFFALRSMLLYVVLMVLFLSSCRTESVPAPDASVKSFTLNAGDTLGASLDETPLTAADKGLVVARLSTLFDPRRCRAGDNYEVTLDSAGALQSFHYYPQGLEFYIIERSSDGAMRAVKKEKSSRKTTVTASGQITTTLWDAMTAQNVKPEIIVAFTDIFAWQIDFLTETRTGDTFKIVYDQHVTDDGIVADSQILAAQYSTGGQNNTAVLFTDSKGRSDYYTPEGKSLRSAFLKAPLQFRRISSYFTRRRYHPVLKYFRPHLGIDYAAPRGTPVSAVGDGTVIFAGRKGGFGNHLQIRHPNNYVTYYGHLQRFARGIRAGARVRQGQVVAYVGSTGLSTGPHLDFRITRDGRFINFLTLRFPAAASVPASERERFRQAKVNLFTQLADVR